MTTAIKQRKIIHPEDVVKIHYPIPTSWKKAAGILRHKRASLARHLKKVCNEWERK